MGPHFRLIAFSLCISLSISTLCTAQSSSLKARFGLNSGKESKPIENTQAPPRKSAALWERMFPGKNAVKSTASQQPSAQASEAERSHEFDPFSAPLVPDVVVSKQLPFPVSQAGSAGVLAPVSADLASRTMPDYQVISDSFNVPEVVVNTHLPPSLTLGSSVGNVATAAGPALEEINGLIPSDLTHTQVVSAPEGPKPIVEQPTLIVDSTQIANSTPNPINRSIPATPVAYLPPIKPLLGDDIGLIGGVDAIQPATVNVARATTQNSDDHFKLMPMKASPASSLAANQLPAAAQETTKGSDESRSYVLRAPAKKSEQTRLPIDILPINKLVSTQPKMAEIDRTYTTETMVGPLDNAASLVTRLNVQHDLRQQPSMPVSMTRTSADASGYGPEWMQQSYAWVAPTFHHKPLYFEQTNLERYGYGAPRGLQPFVSGAHFFGSVGLFPYKLITQHPYEKVYTLGNNRPGDCVPFQRRSLLGQSYPGEVLKYWEDCSGYR